MTPLVTVHDYLYLAAALVLVTLGSARLVRLVVGDSWPPTMRLRMWWATKTKPEDEVSWRPLLSCPWCFAPYVVAVNLFAAWASGLHPAWWIVNLWLAVSYAASWIAFHDED